MSSWRAIHSVQAGQHIRAPATLRLGERAGAAGRSAVRAWLGVRAGVELLGAMLLALTAVSALLWLLYQLASWWIELAVQPFPGTGIGLEELLR